MQRLLAFHLPAPHLHEAAPVAPLVSQPHATFGRWHVRRYKMLTCYYLVEGSPPALFACPPRSWVQPPVLFAYLSTSLGPKTKTSHQQVDTTNLVCALLPHRGVTRKDWKKNATKRPITCSRLRLLSVIARDKNCLFLLVFVYLRRPCPVTVHMCRDPRT